MTRRERPRSIAKFTARLRRGLLRNSGRGVLRTKPNTPEPGLDEELRPVDAVLRGQPAALLEVVDRLGRSPSRPRRARSGRRRPGRNRPEVDVEAVDVVRARAAVEAVPPDHDALPGAVLGDVVRAGAGKRADSLRVGRKRRRHGAEERHRRLRREIGHRLREADDERVAAGDDARRGCRPSGLHGRGADDLLRVVRTDRRDARAPVCGRSRARTRSPAPASRR